MVVAAVPWARAGSRFTTAFEDCRGHRVECRLDALLEERGNDRRRAGRRVGATVVNLSVLKNNRAQAIRFSTLIALCEALSCQPGDLFRVQT